MLEHSNNNKSSDKGGFILFLDRNMLLFSQRETRRAFLNAHRYVYMP